MPDTTDAEGLTVGQVSARLGVTVRALHHWDEIGLARPSVRTTAGYRLYTAGDLERLQRIVVYRELGLGLDRIRAVLDDPAVDVPGAPARLRRRDDDPEQAVAGLRVQGPHAERRTAERAPGASASGRAPEQLRRSLAARFAPVPPGVPVAPRQVVQRVDRGARRSPARIETAVGRVERTAGIQQRLSCHVMVTAVDVSDRVRPAVPADA
ncbi:MerR family transcriptional regulator [Streptomyces sp. NPDC005752]|uniref:MerR family transcriptional regulator n=1 Tax=Streptomyces sp. NPDC005752 TaxID=3157065 RepID=UPI0033DAEA3F